MQWIITVAILVVLAGVWVWLFIVGRRRQKQFDAQYEAAKERREVFVLNKRTIREPGQTRWTRFYKFKVYEVTGRTTLSQSIRGVQMNKAQNVTFRTSKAEYEKIQPNRRYKLDVAGNYIGYVVGPIGKPKHKDNSTAAPAKRSWFRLPGSAQGRKSRNQSAKDKS